jgi:hypothetical protein
MNRKTMKQSQKRTKRPQKRRGVIVVLGLFLMVSLVGIAAFSVDYGYVLVVRTELQRAADAAVLAAVRDLVPDDNGNQYPDTVRATLRQYAADNMEDEEFEVLDEDIEIGRYDPDTIYSGSVTLLSTGVYDAVRVTLRRDANANSPVGLFFGPVLGLASSNVTATATAVIQKGSVMRPGADVLPFSVSRVIWDAKNPGDIWRVYGDGRLTDDAGLTIPGNWGTVDIGEENNSTSALSAQILNGLTQADIDALYEDGRINSDTGIASDDDMWLNADPGLSSGMKSAVQAIHGQYRILPIYDSLDVAGGNNLEFHVVGWGMVKVVDSSWNGNNNTYVRVKKVFKYDADLLPHPDLSEVSNVIDGAYTYPSLVE